jgi:ABC-type transport system involved in multi-copper enzyme maturation permease subunit
MRLISAEILKLRRRRALMLWVSLLTVGSVVVAYAVLLALHAAAPDTNGPAGGAQNLENLLGLFTILAGVAAVLLGTTAGSQDVSAGVFRELVVTGRSRSTLFRVRFPGALAVFLPLVAAGFALAVAGSYVFAGSLPTAGLEEVRGYGVAVLAYGVVSLAAAVALGAVMPGRVATAVLVAWNAVVAPLLMSFAVLGRGRDAIDVAAALHFAPAADGRTAIAMTSGTALVVLALWVAVSQRLGAWWTQRIDA